MNKKIILVLSLTCANAFGAHTMIQKTTNYNNITVNFDLKLNIKNLLKSAATKTQETAGSLIESIQNNKLKIFLTATAGFYTATQLKLIYLKYKLSDDNNWSKYRSDLKLEDLFKIPQDKLAQSLLRDLQKKYTGLNNLTDVAEPLAHFLKDVEQELKYIKNYKSIIIGLKRVKLTKFFWFDYSFLEELTDRKDRLEYIKSVFMAWVVEYKLK